MALLRVLSLIYGAVLVLALAASLIAILVYLRRIAAVLGDVQVALARINRATTPLETHFGALKEGLAEAAEEVDTAQKRFQGIASKVEAEAPVP